MEDRVIYEVYSRITGEEDQQKFIDETTSFLKTCWLTKSHKKFTIEVKQLKTKVNIYFKVPKKKKRKKNGKS